MKKIFSRLPIIIITICLLTILGFGLDSTSCWAQTEDPPTDSSGNEIIPPGFEGTGETTEEGDDDTSDTPVLANPTQVAHAENLAAASAEQANAEAEEAMKALEAAEYNLDNTDPEDEDAIKAAQDDLIEAQARADVAMSQSAGVSAETIALMREEGMGWGEIAHSLGIHPGVLGLGHTKWDIEGQPETDTEITSTTRDTKGGLAVGHGISTGNSSGGKGLGLGYASSNKGNKGGFDGESNNGNAYGRGSGSGQGGGNSNSGGNNGNHGGGNSGSHGNGK